jgi:hypothetical protein
LDFGVKQSLFKLTSTIKKGYFAIQASPHKILGDLCVIPAGGTYSTRVLFYDKTYAGTWSGGEHVGLMNGVITNEQQETPDASQK